MKKAYIYLLMVLITACSCISWLDDGNAPATNIADSTSSLPVREDLVMNMLTLKDSDFIDQLSNADFNEREKGYLYESLDFRIKSDNTLLDTINSEKNSKIKLEWLKEKYGLSMHELNKVLSYDGDYLTIQTDKGGVITIKTTAAKGSFLSDSVYWIKDYVSIKVDKKSKNCKVDFKDLAYYLEGVKATINTDKGEVRDNFEFREGSKVTIESENGGRATSIKGDSTVILENGKIGVNGQNLILESQYRNSKNVLELISGGIEFAAGTTIDAQKSGMILKPGEDVPGKFIIHDNNGKKKSMSITKLTRYINTDVPLAHLLEKEDRIIYSERTNKEIFITATEGNKIEVKIDNSEIKYSVFKPTSKDTEIKVVKGEAEIISTADELKTKGKLTGLKNKFLEISDLSSIKTIDGKGIISKIEKSKVDPKSFYVLQVGSMIADKDSKEIEKYQKINEDLRKESATKLAVDIIIGVRTIDEDGKTQDLYSSVDAEHLKTYFSDMGVNPDNVKIHIPKSKEDMLDVLKEKSEDKKRVFVISGHGMRLDENPGTNIESLTKMLNTLDVNNGILPTTDSKKIEQTRKAINEMAKKSDYGFLLNDFDARQPENFPNKVVTAQEIAESVPKDSTLFINTCYSGQCVVEFEKQKAPVTVVSSTTETATSTDTMYGDALVYIMTEPSIDILGIKPETPLSERLLIAEKIIPEFNSKIKGYEQRIKAYVYK